MLVREAKSIARTWVQEHGVTRVGFLGAILSGSINWADDEEDWPATSDVDVALFFTCDERRDLPLEHSKLFYSGLLLEVSPKLADQCRTAEQVLSD